MAVYFCGIFAFLFVMSVTLVIRNFLKFTEIETVSDVKGRMGTHLAMGALASVSSLGFLISLVFVIIDYVKG